MPEFDGHRALSQAGLLVRRARSAPVSPQRKHRVSPDLGQQEGLSNQATQHLLRSSGDQGTLTVGAPADVYQGETNRVAEPVTPLPDPRVQRQAEPEEDEQELVQAAQAPGQTRQVGSGLTSQIDALRSGGRPLSRSEREFFEPRFGRDFSHVRIHADSRASSLAQAMNARAFTRGHAIVFGGRRDPQGIRADRRLLAHELAHVVQEGMGLRPEKHRPKPSTGSDRGKTWTQPLTVSRIAQPALQRAVRIRNPRLSVTQRPTVRAPSIVPPNVDFSSNAIRMRGQARIDGQAAENAQCSGHTFGFLQTQWVETNRAVYRGRRSGDGSILVKRDRPPARRRAPCSDTSVPGQFWTYHPGETDQPPACNHNVNLTSRDDPADTYRLIERNSRTGKDNYLHNAYLGFAFTTVWSVQQPGGNFRHFRSVYWNTRWYYRFRLNNFAAPNNRASWSFTELPHTGANVSGIISGAPTDRRTPVFTSAQPQNCNAIFQQASVNPLRQERTTW